MDMVAVIVVLTSEYSLLLFLYFTSLNFDFNVCFYFVLAIDPVEIEVIAAAVAIVALVAVTEAVKVEVSDLEAVVLALPMATPAHHVVVLVAISPELIQPHRPHLLICQFINPSTKNIHLLPKEIVLKFKIGREKIKSLSVVQTFPNQFWNSTNWLACLMVVWKACLNKDLPLQLLFNLKHGHSLLAVVTLSVSLRLALVKLSALLFQHLFMLMVMPIVASTVQVF